MRTRSTFCCAFGFRANRSAFRVAVERTLSIKSCSKTFCSVREFITPPSSIGVPFLLSQRCDVRTKNQRNNAFDRDTCSPSSSNRLVGDRQRPPTDAVGAPPWCWPLQRKNEFRAIVVRRLTQTFQIIDEPCHLIAKLGDVPIFCYFSRSSREQEKSPSYLGAFG